MYGKEAQQSQGHFVTVFKAARPTTDGDHSAGKAQRFG
jgi:hypothetical protein